MFLAGDSSDFSLLNDFQRDFPLVSRPFAVMAEGLGLAEADVLVALARLQEQGRVSRVGPVFAPNRLGASTLAALAVPESELAAVAALVSGRAEVNHNYRREHAWNLWFVATAADQAALAAVLEDIARQVALPVLSLPLEQEYHIDLGFDLGQGRCGQRQAAIGQAMPGGACQWPDIENRLVAAMQSGIPLVPRPFAALARAAGLNEDLVLAMIADMLQVGLIKRFGVVVRHHELGWQANAMCVWDVPEDRVDALGELLARESAVTLCYRRRCGPAERAAGWPYNLFCMIHGRQRAEAERQHALLNACLGLAAYPGQCLFSSHRYKQCGARYAAAPERSHG